METILIQNFKAIKNTAKREIKVANLTILMGEQATGKSTVAKLVYFFKKLPEEIVFSLLKEPEIDKNNFESEILSFANKFFDQLFNSSYLYDSFIINYKYNNDLQIEIGNIVETQELYINWPSENFIQLIKEKWTPVYNVAMLLNDDYDSVLYTEYERLSIQFIKIIISLFGYVNSSVFVPASRNMVVSFENEILNMYSELDRSNSLRNYSNISENGILIRDFIKYIQSIKNKFKRGRFNQIIDNQKVEKKTQQMLFEFIERSEEIIAGTYEYSNSGERIYINNSDKYIFLEDSSSGQQESIRIVQDIFLEILEGKPVFRVYEEPESHLSPVGQLGIIQLIAMLANRNPNNQIIIPTHTPYLLQEVSNMLKASKIVKDNPELRDEVSKILKSFYWLDLDSVSAYQLNRDGEIEDAKDIEYQMIDGTLFDKVTNDISDQFDELLKLQDV